ncbi:condensation domain-containing protein [Streptomyces albus]|nr:condensation domain-containing protein [Streptomyces albus]
MADAWQRTVERSDALRVGLVWEGVREPVQVVRRRAEVPVTFLDRSATALTEEAQDAFLREFLDEDRARGIDLATAPLMRVALIRLPGEGRSSWCGPSTTCSWTAGAPPPSSPTSWPSTPC